MSKRLASLILLSSVPALALLCEPAFAEEGVDAQSTPAAESTSPAASGNESEGADSAAEPIEPTRKSSASQSRSRKKGGQPREKDTEGTEAPDRFQADTVIKSEYELDGQKLEVDPD
jgi:hypothetical protein